MSKHELRRRRQAEGDKGNKAVVIGLTAVVVVAALAGVAYWMMGRKPANDAATPVALGPMGPTAPSEPVFEPAANATTPIAELPDAPGAERTGYSVLKVDESGRTGEQAEYTVKADVEVVKKHYLSVFREKGWKVSGSFYPKAAASWVVTKGNVIGKIAVLDDKAGTIKVIAQRFVSKS